MELSGQAHRRDSGRHRQGVLHRPFGPPRPRGRGHHQGRPVRNGPVQLRESGFDPQLCPRIGTLRRAHRRSGKADRCRTTASGDDRTGRDPERRRSGAARLPRQERHARRIDPAGAFGPADRLAAVRRHAGHARQLRSQHQKPGLRPAPRRGHALRRPRDGQSGLFRGERQDHPPRNRPCGDRQDRPTLRWSATRNRPFRCSPGAYRPATTGHGSTNSAPATRSNTKR